MANVLTATADSAFAHVVLRTEFSATGSLTAVVERSIDGGVTWTAVRGSPVTLVGPDPAAGNRVGYLIDTEAPLDTALRYRSTNNLGTVTTAGPVTIVSGGASWMKDPGRPWANLKINDCLTITKAPGCTPAIIEPAITLTGASLGTEGYAGDFTLFPILNARRPADVYALRKDAVTSWRVLSHTLTAMNSLETFYYAGGPILLQLNAAYGWPDRYYQPGQNDVSRIRAVLTDPRRFWDTPLTVVNAPVGPAQGTCEANWCIVDSTYPTYAALAASGFTWGQVLEGAATTC